MILDKFGRFANGMFVGIMIAVALPASLIIGVKLSEDTPSKREILNLAAANFGNYLTENPLRIGWKMTAIRVTQDLRLVVDVKVILRREAKVIKSRNSRIKYSYLKLACPPPDADVFRTLPGGETLWIRLHHQGDTLIEAGCPKDSSIVSIY